MTRKLLLTINTEAKINLIKILREITAWDLLSAKNAFERGIVLSAENITLFLHKLENRVKNENYDRRFNRTVPTELIEFTVNISTYDPVPAPVELTHISDC